MKQDEPEECKHGKPVAFGECEDCLYESEFDGEDENEEPDGPSLPQHATWDEHRGRR